MTIDFLQGDVREVLKTLPNDHFDCVVTSPPYWGLRDYGISGQIGLEPTLKEYIENMVGICGEIRRVMKPTGTFWLNVGDSYDNKNLCMVPNRLAIALQDEGWYIRSEIIWHKPSCMPESVTDRPTQAHEKIWLLGKNSRYYYDAQAVAQYLSSKPHAPSNKKLDESRNDRDSMDKIWGLQGYANIRNVWDCPDQEHEKIWLLTKNPKYYYDFYGVVEHLRSSPKPRGQKLDDSRGDGPRRNEIWGAENPYRNLRNVWSISPKGYEGAHFATFPPALVERCIRAGSSAHGCCPNCGAPWARVIEKGESLKEWKESCGADSHGGYNGVAQKDYAAHGVQDASATKARILAGMVEKRTTGWRQTCKCVPGRVIPSRVLDPFGGSGTTGLVADILASRRHADRIKS